MLKTGEADRDQIMKGRYAMFKSIKKCLLTAYSASEKHFLGQGYAMPNETEMLNWSH